MSLDALARDLRFALRTLRRDAGFATFVILIAGLGIGASATVFTVVHTLLLRPLPFAEPDQLVWIANRDVAGLSGQTTQVGHMVDLTERTQTLSAVTGYFAFYGAGDNLLSGRGEPERLNGVPVAGNFFEVLGVQPLHGRFFVEDETRWAGPKAVVLGHGLWRRRFASDPAVVGTSLVVNDEPHTVVGVLPASFDFGSVFAPGSSFDLFFPFPLSPETHRWGNTMAMIGRLKPGVTPGEAQAEVTTIARQLATESADRNSFGGVVKPLAEHVNGRVQLAVWVLAAAVGMVMLIVCANVANLLLARAASRQKEFAVRSALGAGRLRLLTAMLAESAVLSAGGAIVGVAVAVVATRGIASLDGINIPLLSTLRVDGMVLAFASALAGLSALVFGVAPWLQAGQARLRSSLSDASRGSTEGRSRRWTRNALVVAEIAFACVLLVGAGLLVRSLARVLAVDMGFDAARAAAIRVDPDSRYTTPADRDRYLDEVLRRVSAIPGVEAAGITDALPLGRNRTWGARAKGVVYERGRAPIAFVRITTDGYFAAMGIPILAGRDISPSDVRDSEPVIVINESMARALWPGEDAIGKYVLNACAQERRVVGVVGDVRHLALEQPSGNEMYVPMRQCDDRPTHDLVVRSALPAGSLVASIREALRSVAPNLPASDFRPLGQIVDRSLSPRRFTVLLLGAFAAFALVLASLGIYALISYSVNRRTQEIGIRMALGATAAHVRRQIVVQTLQLGAAGIVIGAAASWLLARGMEGLLFDVAAGDPLTFGGMAAVLMAVAAAAGYVPARRAAAIDPMAALRIG